MAIAYSSAQDCVSTQKEDTNIMTTKILLNKVTLEFTVYTNGIIWYSPSLKPLEWFSDWSQALKVIETLKDCHLKITAVNAIYLPR